MTKRITRALMGMLTVAGTAVLLVAPSATAAPASGSTVTNTTIRIWSDRDRKPAVERVAAAWAASRGVTVEVVEKDFGKIRDDLKTVQAATAPDVIVGAHDWTGELAADGSVVPIIPRAAVSKQFPGYALDAFSYGTSVKRLYGAPVALENIGLVVNTKLAKVPTDFASLQKQALAFKRKKAGNLAIAVPQGANGDAYHMYPFFSGLCGYVFGTNKSGTLNPKNIGLRSPRFLANTPIIDGWNKTGLVNSKVDYGTAKDAFLKGKAAFWITGPWESDTLKQSGISFRIVQVPAIKCKSVPFLGVQGFMVTKFAKQHGVETFAKNLVGDYMMSASAQRSLAAANGRYPANTTAGKQVSDRVLQQFGAAGTGGVPMPNIPQMAAVWSELGGAWVKSTKGAGATKARPAFTTAARNIAAKIG
ncbi:MAG TPA: extracellular solute-binding protein [Gaiellaceae bacterium]|nr:extracellular solute-binding protein [Gaiellaceae bacterium]